MGATDVASFIAEGETQDFVAAIEAKDGEALDNLIEKTRPREAGEVAGATKYEDGGTIFAVKDDVVVFAASEELLDQALERAEGDDHLDEETFNAGLEGLPGGCRGTRVHGSSGPDRLGPGRPGGPQRQVGGRAAHDGPDGLGAESEIEIELKVRTDPEGLTDEDLPIAAGDEAPPVLSREGEIGIGIRESGADHRASRRRPARPSTRAASATTPRPSRRSTRASASASTTI